MGHQMMLKIQNPEMILQGFKARESCCEPSWFFSPKDSNCSDANGFESNGVDNNNNNQQQQQQMVMVNSGGGGGSNGDESYKNDMRDLEDLLSKLNPMAEEFVPPSLAKNSGYPLKNGYTQGRRRNYHKLSPAQRDAMIRRTVYVSDIDQQVVDCRVCGDPNSILRFAFVEFQMKMVQAALSLSGTMLGESASFQTAIAPVNPTFCRGRMMNVKCAQELFIVTQADVKLFFESLCGEVQRLRLLGDYHHSTRIAFVEFTMAESAIAALNCSGVVLGTLPIRVSPSKTPVRPRAPRPPLH
ncbi:hypothetical protein F8388_006373 [Cannabis sativa]|uniref:RRM domain-containing protein n=1 Tax=Cannabis sativa TaxID=3483 RepID=A0A7J6EG26_CANSA|nr:hypothetical protein F8388_006373 [Cannabis sativa]